jgi:N-acetylglutamate synthase-like GNAT family acetyltransferase
VRAALTYRFHQRHNAIEVIVLSTDKHMRGQGHASALLHRLKNKAVTLKASFVIAKVSVVAIDWYKNRHFTLTPEDDPRFSETILSLRQAENTVTMHWTNPFYEFKLSDPKRKLVCEEMLLIAEHIK